jgi:hypothetical protein
VCCMMLNFSRLHIETVSRQQESAETCAELNCMLHLCTRKRIWKRTLKLYDDCEGYEKPSPPYPPTLSLSLMAQQHPVGHGLLIIEASRSYSDTPHSVGLPWTSDQPDAETSTRQPTTLTTDRHSCLRKDSNPQSQQANDTRLTSPTARPLGSALPLLAQ